MSFPLYAGCRVGHEHTLRNQLEMLVHLHNLRIRTQNTSLSKQTDTKVNRMGCAQDNVSFYTTSSRLPDYPGYRPNLLVSRTDDQISHI